MFTIKKLSLNTSGTGQELAAVVEKAVEHTPRNEEVMGLNPALNLGFIVYSFYPLSSLA